MLAGGRVPAVQLGRFQPRSPLVCCAPFERDSLLVQQRDCALAGLCLVIYW